MQGTLIIWNAPKAFGFIQPDATTDVSDRLFVHISNFAAIDRGNVRLGARIEFTVGEPIAIGKKPQATRAKVLTVNTASTSVNGANALKAVL